MNSQTNPSRTSAADFASDLRISIAPLIATLFTVGVSSIYLASLPLALFQREVILVLGYALLGFIPAVVWFERRNWIVGRYLVLLLVVLSVDTLSTWLGIQASLILVPIAIAYGVAVADFKIAFVLAVIQMVFVLLLPVAFGVEVLPFTEVISMIAVWASYAVMILVYYPIRRVGLWVTEFYQQARELTDETRQHREAHEQVVKDLAQANLQMARLNVLAQGLRQSAEAARTAKEQFVANVSHELRTPLNMIIGFSEMMLQSPEMYGMRIPPLLLADLDVIHRNAEHLTELVDDVLDLSQIEADKMGLTKEYVQFREIVDAAAQAVRPLYETKRLYLTIEVQDDLPRVFCDPTRIREVLLNLLSNAGRFTEHGGIHLCVLHDACDVIVSVSDTGRGISAVDMDKLFQPFQQLDGTVRRLYGGSGLGLIISKQFIELHGGTITAQSEPGAGTTFTFRLPIIPPTPLSETPTRWLNPNWANVQRTGPSKAPEPVVRPRFLVVETGEVLTRLMARYAAEGQAEIVHRPTIACALEELAHTPALALLVNSSTVTKGLDSLKTSVPLPDGIPALVCAVPDPRDTQAELGISDALVKPISQGNLLAALDRLGITQGTVLVVDDEPDSLQLFDRMLAASKRGYRVLQARDGQVAMSILEEYRPDVILLDLMMPNMDGFQVLAVLRESPTLHDIPVVIISAREPNGQPIMCNTLAVVQAGGISAQQLLTCVHAITEILSLARYVAPRPTADLAV